jgi:hypothetical protein
MGAKEESQPRDEGPQPNPNLEYIMAKTTFTAAQTRAIRSLLGAIHPDKNPERIELATALTAAANKARDDGDWATLAKMLEALEKGTIWAQQEEDKPEPEKEQETKKGKGKEQTKVEINAELLAKYRSVVESEGYDKRKMGGWLQLNTGLSAREIKAYLDELFVEVKASRGKSIAARFYERLEQGPLSREEFDLWIAGESKGAQAYTAHYWAIAEMTNAIWNRK